MGFNLAFKGLNNVKYIFVLKFGQGANAECCINYLNKNTPYGTPEKAEKIGNWLGVWYQQKPRAQRSQRL
jgi:hypothetical protein